MPKQLRFRVPFECKGPSRTKQSFKDECNINNIMIRYEKTGIMEHIKKTGGSYEDYTDLPTDYHTACNQVIAAQDMFQSIPARIRASFDNDPGEFLAFVSNSENMDQMVEMGLAQRRPPEANATETSETSVKTELVPEVPEPSLKSPDGPVKAV